MKILFVTFGELSFTGRDFRSAAMVRALAEAGHQLTVAAAHAALPAHPNIRILEGQAPGLSRRKIRKLTAKASRSLHFDAVHAVDAAGPFSAEISRRRKIPLFYDASRCFSGRHARPGSNHWKWFPNYFSGQERALLSRAAAVICPDPILQKDLSALCGDAQISLIENVPRQSFFCLSELEREPMLQRFGGRRSSIVVCALEGRNHSELRMLLMAVRKVIDAFPAVQFVFKGASPQEAEPMAASLAIEQQCCFLDDHENGIFLAALEAASASILIPDAAQRYRCPEIFTLLHAPAPAAVVIEGAHADLLTDKNSMPVLRNTDSIADGIIQMIREPLFSLGLSTEGQQLIADHFSLSTFKHKVRMLYHETLNKS